MKKFFILVTIGIVSISCTSPDANEFNITLPEATLVGANTFGCYANGILITPRDGSGTVAGPDKGMKRYIGPLPENIEYREIRVHDYASNRTSSMTLHFRQLDTLGVQNYIVGNSNCLEGSYNIETNNIQCRIYDQDLNLYISYCSIADSGFLNVTRYGDGYLSGTFYCRAANIDDPDDIIEITDGRFDTYGPSLPTTIFP